MVGKIDVTITCLEQTRRPALSAPPAPRGKIAILRAETPPIHFYRYLYETVGAAYNWISRARMDDDALTALVHDPAVEIFVLYMDGSPAGFSEIEFRDPAKAEIRLFGLLPDYVGRGLGRFFLWNVIELCWMRAPSRVLIETCTLDHPAALPLYQKLGFSVFDQKKGRIDAPR